MIKGKLTALINIEILQLIFFDKFTIDGCLHSLLIVIELRQAFGFGVVLHHEVGVSIGSSLEILFWRGHLENKLEVGEFQITNEMTFIDNTYLWN